MVAQFGQGSVFHINHILPRSRGGPTLMSNLVLQCPSCSLHKSDKITAIDPRTGAIVRLFHPLTQSWDEHFALHANGRCTGKTAVGRATVQALHMNDVLPWAARALQLELGILEL